MTTDLHQQFQQAATLVGASVVSVTDVAEVASYIADRLEGALLTPNCPSLARLGVLAALESEGASVQTDGFRQHGATAEAGLSGANFGIAATGTVVLESTAENVRIATTLPEKHFVVLDPAKIVADYDAALPMVRQFHEQLPQAYLAYLTGPSRTADIERVLTIGVHGPKELHLLWMEGVSDDPLER